MSPWDAHSFKKHNKDATVKELEIGAAVANNVLGEGGSDGAAVRAGNAAILRHRRKHKKE